MKKNLKKKSLSKKKKANYTSIINFLPQNEFMYEEFTKLQTFYVFAKTGINNIQIPSLLILKPIS